MYIIDTYLDKDRLPVLEKKELCRETQTLNSPDMTFDFLNRYFRLKDRTEEYIYLLAFDKKCHLIGIFELSHGTVDSSLITPREVFMKALLCGASGIILAHNHPSGDVSDIFHDEKTVLYLTGSDKIRNEKLIAEITLILDDILNGKMDLSQHLTLMVNDFGHLAGGINFPHKLSRIKGTQVSAILCTESLLPLQTEHYNPMLTDEILDSCNVITEK